MTTTPLNSANALEHAIELLDLAHGRGNPEINATIETLTRILGQQVAGGLLTELIDSVLAGTARVVEGAP